MIINAESDEENSIIPTKDVIKRIAVVDGCNVLHFCAGMGLYSRAEQEMFDQRKPDAIGLLLVVKKLMEEDFDVRVFLSFSYMSDNKVSNLFILQEFKTLGILTVVSPDVHDDIAILEYATQVGGFIVSNDKFREFKYCPKMSKCTKCVERTIRFKFRRLKKKNDNNRQRSDIVYSGSSTSDCSLPRKKSKSDMNNFQLGMELQMEIDPDLCTSNIKTDIDFLFVHSCRIRRSKYRQIQTLNLINVMIDFLQLEFTFIHGIKPQPLDYFKGHIPPSKFSNFLMHFNKHLRHQQENIFRI
ncbi:hypothetical protein ACQ4LE_008017 [Meloidogyne hapla]